MKPADTSSLPLPKVAPNDRLGAVLPVAAETALAGADLTNVIVLAHRRSASDAEAPPVTFKDDERPAPVPTWRDRTPWTALIAAALLLHLAFVLFFMRDPAPIQSLALDSISVEIVLGGQTEAGIAQAASPVESAPAPASDSSSKAAERPAEATEPTRPDLRPRIETADRQAEEQKTDEPKPQVAKREAQPEGLSSELSKPEEPQSTTPEPQPSVEASDPEPAKASSEPARAAVSASAEVDPAPTKADLEKPEQPQEAQDSQPPPRQRPTEAQREQSKPTPPAVAASRSGVGVGSSREVRDWAARLSASLARNKRYPTDALAGGIGGTASVSFTVGSDGQVTSVRLARSSGNASLDRESLDLVRRTSPFPPPPHGKASITVPVNFSVRTGR